MNKVKSLFMQLPIRVKLGSIFFFAFFLLFGVMIFFYSNVNATVNQIDSVYASNTRLNSLRDTLENVQNNLYQYLNTRSSEALENYYIYEASFIRQLGELNNETINNTPLLLEKNISNISGAYLELTNAAIEAKRARNIALYGELHEHIEGFYQYLNATIFTVNDMNFRQNSANYLVLRNALDNMIGMGIVFMLLIVLLAIAWSVFMTRSITQPLVAMAAVANEVAGGNMDANFPHLNTNDELGSVAKASNRMLSSIREYIESTKEHMVLENLMKERALIMDGDLKEAQLRYLQAQINPHFLFNTLNAGVQLSMLEGAEKTEVFLEKVADFFRYNVKKMGRDTTIREELNMIDTYIYILNVRYLGEINYEKKYDSRLLDIRMPSMVLQPIVENAITHGIHETERDGNVQLSLHGENNKVVISIKDNGKGIDDEIAKKIMSGEALHKEGDSTGIGLDNVISRLRSYFNQEDVFVIRNREDVAGTEVILYLPMVVDEAKKLA